MKSNIYLFICLIIFIQMTYTIQFEDLIIFRSQDRANKKENVKFLQQTVENKVDENIIEGSNSTNITTIPIPFTNSTINSTSDSNKTRNFLRQPVNDHIFPDITGEEISQMNATALNSTYYLCNEIEQVFSHMVDLDNAISELRESFLNQTKMYVQEALQQNVTEEEKSKLLEKEDNLVMNYVNKINELNVLIQSFKAQLMTLAEEKCPNLSTASLHSQLSNSENNLNSLISLISEQVKELKLPVKFIALSSQK